MTSEERDDIRSKSTRFLTYHRRRTLPEVMREIADAPYSDMPRDMYGKGGFVTQFETEIASLLGKESAVFMPSGTMAQQIALRLWNERRQTGRVAWHPTCHLEVHEFAAYRELCGLESILLGDSDRLFTKEDLQSVNQPYSTLLVELPQREIGGQLPSWEELQDICRIARATGAFLHLDGARLWESAPFYGRSYAEIAAPFDSVYVSFYKILDGLPGALLAGPEFLIEQARTWQRRYGGNLVTMAPNAISAKLGMERHLSAIAAYVKRASEVAAIFRSFDEVAVVPATPPTNLFHLHIKAAREALIDASYELARETGCLLFGGMAELLGSPGVSKTEITIGSAALDISDEELRAWIPRLLEGASQELAY